MLKSDAKILIVDDMQTMRMIVKQTVEGLGYKNLELAKDGDTAWSFLQRGLGPGVQLILSDWNMPGSIDGLELLKKVRQSSQHKAIPFLMLTAKSETADVEAAKKEGVTGFLSKPFSPVELKAVLAAIFKAV